MNLEGSTGKLIRYVVVRDYCLCSSCRVQRMNGVRHKCPWHSLREIANSLVSSSGDCCVRNERVFN